MKLSVSVLAWLVAPFFFAAGLRAESAVTKTRESIVVGGESRYYVVCRPTQMPPGAHPLLVGFHGYRGEVKSWLHDYTVFDQFIAEKGLIIAYPEGPVSWQSTPASKDLPFFDALIAKLDQEFSVDRSRIYVFGHSNGARFASFLLGSRHGVVAAAAAHSGIFPLSYHALPTTAHKAPLFVIWGEKDEMAPAASPAVQANITAYEKAGFKTERLVLPNWGHSWGGSTHQVEPKIIAFFFAHSLPNVKK